MTPLARKLLTGFALLGLGASSAATYVHYNLIQNPDYSSFCDINATVSCKAAYLSRYGSIAGVPVAVGGIVFFVWVLLMLWASTGKSRIRDSAPAYLFAGRRSGSRSCSISPTRRFSSSRKSVRCASRPTSRSLAYSSSPEERVPCRCRRCRNES
jgi:hypothetical protein